MSPGPAQQQKGPQPPRDNTRRRLSEIFTVCMCVWVFLVMSLLLVVGVIYMQAVQGTRTMYVEQAVRPRLHTTLKQQLEAGTRTRDVLHYAIRKQFYMNPFDYDTVDRLLAPMFEAHPILNRVELAFADKDATITATREPVDEEDVAYV